PHRRHRQPRQVDPQARDPHLHQQEVAAAGSTSTRNIALRSFSTGSEVDNESLMSTSSNASVGRLSRTPFCLAYYSNFYRDEQKSSVQMSEVARVGCSCSRTVQVDRVQVIEQDQVRDVPARGELTARSARRTG